MTRAPPWPAQSFAAAHTSAAASADLALLAQEGGDIDKVVQRLLVEQQQV
jgi:hypothetical protein